MNRIAYIAAKEQYATEFRALSDAEAAHGELCRLLVGIRELRSAADTLQQVQRKINTKLVPIETELNFSIDMHRQIEEKKQELLVAPSEFAELGAALKYDVLQDSFEAQVAAHDESCDIVPIILLACYLRLMEVQNGSVGQKMLNFAEAVLGRYDFAADPELLQALRALDAQRYRFIANQYLTRIEIETSQSNATAALWGLFERLKQLEKQFEAELGDVSELGNAFELHLNRLQFDISRLIESKKYSVAQRTAVRRHLRPVLEFAEFAVSAEATLESIAELAEPLSNDATQKLISAAFSALPEFVQGVIKPFIERQESVQPIYTFKEQTEPFREYIEELMHKQFREQLEQCKFDTMTDPKFAGELATLFSYKQYREIFVQCMLAQLPGTCTPVEDRSVIDELYIIHELFKEYDTFEPIMGLLQQRIDSHIESIILERYRASGRIADNLAEIATGAGGTDEQVFDKPFAEMICKTVENFEKLMEIQVGIGSKVRELFESESDKNGEE